MTKPIMPDNLSKQDFLRIYREHLEQHSFSLIEEIKAMLAQPVHSDVNEIYVEVFPDEYGDGYVSIGMYFEGKNKKVDRNDKSFFPGRYLGFAEYANNLPMIDVEAYNEEFYIADITVEEVKQWFVSCWNKAGGKTYHLPVTIHGHEDFGNGKILTLTDIQ